MTGVIASVSTPKGVATRIACRFWIGIGGGWTENSVGLAVQIIHLIRSVVPNTSGLETRVAE